MSGIHDAFFKLAMEALDEVAAWFGHLLADTGLRVMALRSVAAELVTDDTGALRADAIFEARLATPDGAPVPALFLLFAEHQSRVDADLPLRLLQYQAMALRSWRERDPKGPLPLTLAWVVYTGRRRWTPALDLRDQASGLPAAWRDRLLGQQIGLIDLRRMPEVRGAARGSLRIAWELLGRERPSAMDVLREHRAALREAIGRRGRTWLGQLAGYVMRVEPSDADPIAWAELLDAAEDMEVVMSWASHIEARGFEKGIEAGIAKGLEQGLETGIAKGIAKGLEQGIETGVERGLRDALLRVGVRRLGPAPAAVADAIALADAATLTAWLDRAADADTWAHVVG